MGSLAAFPMLLLSDPFGAASVWLDDPGEASIPSLFDAVEVSLLEEQPRTAIVRRKPVNGKLRMGNLAWDVGRNRAGIVSIGQSAMPGGWSGSETNQAAMF
jgi:hypothetical protein